MRAQIEQQLVHLSAAQNCLQNIVCDLTDNAEWSNAMDGIDKVYILVEQTKRKLQNILNNIND